MSKHLKNYAATRAATRLVMDAAQSEKAKAGRVTMPKVFFVIGIIGFVLLTTATFLCGRIPHMIGIAAGFAILALPDLALIIAYFNQRIYYTDEMFVHKNFWGIKRLYRYEDITGIRIDGDVNLFLGKRKVRIYDRAVGKKEFVRCAGEGYHRVYDKGIPLVPRKKNDIFNGNIKNPGEAIAVGIILIGGMALIYWFMLYGMWALSIKTKDELTVSTVAFNHCEIQDDAIQLYGDSEKCYIIPKYKRVMPDADEFLDEYQNGGTLILGYDKANDNVNLYVYTVESNDGRMFVTFEKSDTLQREVFRQCKAIPKPITTLMIFPPIVMLLFVAAGLYVGRHVEKFSPKTVHIFYQNSNINWPNSKKKPSAKKRKKRK